MARPKTMWIASVRDDHRMRDFARALKLVDKQVAKELRLQIARDFTEPLVAYMKADARAAGRHGPRLAKTLEARSTSMLPTIRIGSLGEPTWAGAVFGGRSQERKQQTMTWPGKNGKRRRGVIKRRQTMQFLPHLGTNGYLVYPTWRRHDQELMDRLAASLDGFVRDKLGGE